MKKLRYVALLIFAVGIGVFSWPKRDVTAVVPLSQRAFAKPELRVSTATVPLPDVINILPNAAAWTSFLSRQPGEAAAYIDPRSGTAASLAVRVPLIPGTGKGNTMTLADLGMSLGRAVTEVSTEVVAAAVKTYVLNNLDVLAVSADQLGPVQAAQVSNSLWHFSIPQEAGGVRVRDARLLGAVSHGNLVVLGTEMWSNVQVDTRPTIMAGNAMSVGFAYVGGMLPEDVIWKQPVLELLPYAPAGREIAYVPGGSVGQGYGHRLVWSLGIERPPEAGRWEVLIDAHAGEVISFYDALHYAKKRIKGGVYPSTDTEICPSSDRCGYMQDFYPMPWTNTGLTSPNDPYTNGAGVFNSTSGTATTTLTGFYYKVTDECGALSETASGGGDLNLGGTNGQHRCDAAATSAGNVPAARSSYYEVNKIAENARGWLLNNTWLRTGPPNQFKIKALEGPVLCTAFYDNTAPPPDVPFIKFSKGDFNTTEGEWVCRTPGEISTIVAHEWGHALDDNDSIGAMSNTSEAYADVAAMYREQVSCSAYGNRGKYSLNNMACPTAGSPYTSDVTGFNQKLNNTTGPSHCFTDCSGAREADYLKHADGQPDTPQNFVCQGCTQSTRIPPPPCGKEEHCAATPVDQAAWDLVKPGGHLRSAPFSFDSVTAFAIANKLFYQGSGNVGLWYSCDCGAGTSGGCVAGSGYYQWVVADDDNGTILDGTPHATALAAAFERHNIGCPGLIPGNSGCSAGPTAAPVLTSAIMSPSGVDLSWTSVPGAEGYWVLRTEGHAGCNLGQTRISVEGVTSYHDAEVAESHRRYFYSVMADGIGSPDACVSPSSACKMPDQVATLEQMGTGTIVAGSHVDVRTSNNVREKLKEALAGGISRLSHVWQFDHVPATTVSPATTLKLALEGKRPNNSESDNFQFAYSVDGGINYTNITGAVINSQLEQTGVTLVIGQPQHTGTVFIRVQDTNQTSGSVLDTVEIDYLVLRVE